MGCKTTKGAKVATPNPKAATPEPTQATPEPGAEPKAATPKPKAATPKPKGAPPRSEMLSLVVDQPEKCLGLDGLEGALFAKKRQGKINREVLR